MSDDKKDDNTYNIMYQTKDDTRPLYFQFSNSDNRPLLTIHNSDPPRLELAENITPKDIAEAIINATNNLLQNSTQANVKELAICLHDLREFILQNPGKYQEEPNPMWERVSRVLRKHNFNHQNFYIEYDPRYNCK